MRKGWKKGWIERKKGRQTEGEREKGSERKKKESEREKRESKRKRKRRKGLFLSFQSRANCNSVLVE